MAVVDRDEYSTIRFWDHLVQRGASNAIETIRDVIRREGLSGDALALAHGAAGRCLFEAGRIEEARSSAAAALGAVDGVSDEVRHWVAMGASFVLAEAGQIDEALAQLQVIARESDGVELGRVHVQTAAILHHAGRLHESLVEFDAGQRLLEDQGQAAEQIRLRNNRGVVLLQQGQFVRADDDFRAAERIAADTELWSAQAQSVANRAVLLGRSRRLADSIGEFERAAELYERAGSPARLVAIMSIDQAEVMMHSGLLADAVEAGHAAIASIRQTGNSVLLGDAQLISARAEMASGRLRAANGTASSATRTFIESDRGDMVPQARSVEVTVALLAARTEVDVTDQLSEAATVIDSLRAAGWDDPAAALAVVRVRAARRWHLTETVAADVERLRAGVSDGRRDTALLGWWAEAVAHESAGHTDAAAEACHAGLDILDDIIAEAPSLEKRSAAMKMGGDLSQLLLDVAVADRDAETALAAAEGTRARSLHDELAESTPHQPLTLRGAVRLRSDLVDRLGDRSLVEWIVARDEVWAVVLQRAGCRLVRIGSYGEIARARDRVVMWLDLAAEGPDDSSFRAMRAARLLDDLLIAPLGLPPANGVVVVPVDLLHGIPWSGLPGLADRPLALSPNAQVWLGADRRAVRPGSGVGLVVGPELEGAEVERTVIERLHPNVVVAAGEEANASTVSSMFSDTDLVHVAAHGRFRSDHPLLSTLRLGDGEITMYDAVPERVNTRLAVLSSCEGGAQGTADGSEVLGFSSILLARGAGAVLAPLTVVRELECADFVAQVHVELAAGEPIACAVANVRERWLAADDLSRWAVASSFTCFGSGRVTVAD